MTVHWGQRRHLNFRQPEKLLERLFRTSAAGIATSGDSGSGKTNLIHLLMQAVAKTGESLFFIDPHGEAANHMRDFCLAGPRSLRDRLVWIEPGNTDVIASLNPLSIGGAPVGGFRWQAKLANKVSHVAHILLSAWGEADFDSKPLLHKWTTRLLRTLAFTGLSLADARMFLDTGNPVFQRLVQAIPDLMARTEFEELAGMRPREREDLIASTKNRFLGLLDNPLVEAILGKVTDVLDVGDLYRRGAIVLISLEPQGVLRTEDVLILANLWLYEILHVVFNSAPADRRKTWVFIDELPVFKACAPLLSDALTQVRKFLCRFVCCSQGAQNFPDRQNDRLLQNLIGQCGVHLYLRHVNPSDSKFFGEVLALPDFDPMRRKHELWQKQQYQAGNRLTTLIDSSVSEGSNDTVGGGDTVGETSADNWSHDQSSTNSASEGKSHDEEYLRIAVSESRARASGERHGRGGSRGTQRTNNSSWQRGLTKSASQTWKQTLVPVLRWRDVLTSVTFFSTEEQVLMAAKELSNLPTGHAMLHIAGAGVWYVRLPLARKEFRLTPRYRKKMIAEFLDGLLGLPGYDTPHGIAEQRTLTIDALLSHLDDRAVRLAIPDSAEHMPRPLIEVPPAGNSSLGL